ncbi:MAG: hypothetical protein J5725_02235, partial [Bacteroidales bacterium]|nr:hypothetical protein [Bacteroidales bacterium]
AMIGNIYANNTILSTDRTPYLNRPCLTPTGFSSYVREKLIGCSVAWNQILPNGNFGDTSVWTALKATMSIASNVATLVPNGQSASNIEIYEKPAKKSTKGVGHKYLISLEIKPSQTVNVNLAGFTGGQTRIISSATANTWTNGQAIINCTNDTIADFYIYSPNESFSTSDSVQVRNIQIIDLTLAFGSSVADTLYAMANNGGIDWLRNHNYPIDQYTQYGYGLYSSKPSAKKVVGFNKWDEQYQGGYYNASGVYVSASGQLCTKNMIPVFPNTAYCFRTTATGNNVCYYDKSGVFISRDSDVPKNGTFTTPNNAYYINISFGTSYGGTYNNDICINISDTNKNGTYEPYSCTTYSLGNTELRGHLIVQNGEIVAEGDVRESNGNITRKYKRVNLGDYNWTKSSDLFVSDVISDCVVPSSGWNTDVICSYYAVDPNATDKRLYGIGTGAKLAIKDTAYNDATAFKTAMNGIYLEYPLATPTTEQSTPFADPMSLNGCTTEEYVDDRSIPVPVGHETQYMGQSEDVIPIPSMPQSDGVWVQKCYVSGGKAQYVWELET